MELFSKGPSRPSLPAALLLACYANWKTGSRKDAPRADEGEASALSLIVGKIGFPASSQPASLAQLALK